MSTGRLVTIRFLFVALAAGIAVCPGTVLSDDEATAQAATSKPAEKPTTQQAVEKAVEKVAEKAAEKAVEKAAEVKAAKKEITSKRPDEWFGPTEVKFFIFVVDIDGIDDAEQNFMANVYIRLRWQDRRLSAPGNTPRQVPLEDVWNPRVLLANRQGLVSKSLPDVVQVDADGSVTYHQRYTGRLSQPLLLSDFPMDTHTFTVQFAAAGYTKDDLTFVVDTMKGTPDLKGGAMSDRLSLPDWNVLEYAAEASPYSPVAAIKSAGFSFQFKARRYVAYYYWQVVLPLSVIVVMSWASFWVDTSNVGVRVGVATSSILTLIAHRFVLARLLPRLPYMTRMDYLSVGSTVLVLVAMLVVLWTSMLGKHKKTALAERVDFWARFAFPGVFLLILGWFVSGVWVLQ
jgi:hypothetical protein